MARCWPSVEIGFTSPDPARREATCEAVAAILDDHQPAAIEERGSTWLASFASAGTRDEAMAALSSLGGTDLTVEPLELPDEDWASRCQAGLTPIHVGRLVVTPPWFARSQEVVDRPVVVVIEPSMGFGTGHHATTRLCLEALQSVDPSGKRVLDVGTGSGVLALAAALLGAREVTAIDNDPDAVASARDNLGLNPAAGSIDLSVADLRDSPPSPAAIVLANLTGAMLTRFGILAHRCDRSRRTAHREWLHRRRAGRGGLRVRAAAGPGCRPLGAGLGLPGVGAPGLIRYHARREPEFSRRSAPCGTRPRGRTAAV